MVSNMSLALEEYAIFIKLCYLFTSNMLVISIGTLLNPWRAMIMPIRLSKAELI